MHRWKWERQRRADHLGIAIFVRHLPPDTCKRNKFKHQLFSFISQIWRGKPLTQAFVITDYIVNQSSTFLLGSDLDLNLDVTLGCGQAFRWSREPDGCWMGVIGSQIIRVWQENKRFYAQTLPRSDDHTLLRHYFQLDVSLAEIVKTFPDDPHLRTAVKKYAGLRLLRQDPWECLASFILSSTKKITHIRQIVAAICQMLGERIQDSPREGTRPIMPEVSFTFPSPQAVARGGAAPLRQCKAGFRAEYLYESAQIIASGQLNLKTLSTLSYADAHHALMQLPGVGPKIADCVLLFAYGRPEAFPMDVWIERALRQLYFRHKRPSRKRLEEFRKTYFGPNAGYAQQYLFHYVRMNPEVLN